MPLKLIPFYYYRRAISTLCLILETKIFSTKLIETHKNSSLAHNTQIGGKTQTQWKFSTKLNFHSYLFFAQKSFDHQSREC